MRHDIFLQPDTLSRSTVTWTREGTRHWAKSGKVTESGQNSLQMAKSGMSENVVVLPALQIEPGPGGEELEAGLRQSLAALAGEHGVELLAQRAEMEQVGGRIGKLRIGQGRGAPVARLLLLRQVDTEHLPRQILQAMT